MAPPPEPHPDLPDEALTYTERLYRQGWREGYEEGYAEGYAEGLAEARDETDAETYRQFLTHVLPEQLGPPPRDAARWLAEASLTQLDAAIERIFELEQWSDLTCL